MIPGSRLDALRDAYDLIVVGGGITGAGILREAARAGASVLLLEQGDYASGTSSGSSKLVHGGLRYLKTGQWQLTLESVRERQRLMGEAPGLVEPQTFIMPVYRHARPGRASLRLGLWIYDRMAGSTRSRWLDADAALRLEPGLRRESLLGALQYLDAGTDDARLVLRLVLEACAEGGRALNYVGVEDLLSRNGRVAGVRARDTLTGVSRDLSAKVVINATGAWADRLGGAPPGAPKLRPLRGSHYVFPASRLPLKHAVSWLHPRDRRPIFAYPWQGAAVYGTTDLDHPGDPGEAAMTQQESAYLLEGLDYQFPGLGLTAADAISIYAAVRPVVATGQADPSAESRESALWSSPGLVNIAGGKLTTFRVTARKVLALAARQSPDLRVPAPGPVFTASGTGRLDGRLGAAVHDLRERTPREEQQAPIAGTPYTWAELRWAARHEQVQHLDDLLLRRLRLGLVVQHGASVLLPRVREICAAELGWDARRWDDEEARYLALWRRRHAPRPG